MVNRHFLANKHGDLSFFFCCFELSNKFLCVKYSWAILSVEQKAVVGNVNLAGNRDCNPGAIVRTDLLGINKLLLFLNEHRDP